MEDFDVLPLTEDEWESDKEDLTSESDVLLNELLDAAELDPGADGFLAHTYRIKAQNVTQRAATSVATWWRTAQIW